MDKNINTPLVSVIMPAYNVSGYIKEAINSVIAQTYADWELIIVDDGSTDNTSDLVEEYLLKDSRIQYFYQENGKQGKARNLAISKSKGEYLAFLDADDLWLPEKLEIQIKEIKDKDVDLVFSNAYIINEDKNQNISKQMNVKTAFFRGEKALKLFLKANRIPILTVLVKKENVLKVDCFSEKINIQNAEDYHLWLKLLISNAVFFSTDKVLARYRIHNNSVSALDNMSVVKILDVFNDLSLNYPNYKSTLNYAMKETFKKFYINNLFTKPELAIWIIRNSQYLSKFYISYFYLFLNLLLPTKITKRTLIYILNA